MTPGNSGGGASPKVELVLTVEGREYRREFGNADQVLVKYGKTAEATNAKVSLLTAGIGRMFGAFSAAATAGFIVKKAREFEDLNAQLLTVEKSEPRARLAFMRIQEFAATTPYQLNEVVEAFIKLRNLGLDPSEEALTAYGNTASSMGKSLNQLIEAVADASTGEFERLKDFGITTKSEGDKVRFTFRGITTTVKKNSEEIQRYLMGLGNTYFASGMQRQMDTLSGATSNFGDAVAVLASRIDSGTGLTAALKEALKWTTSLINEMAGVSRAIPEIESDIAELEKTKGFGSPHGWWNQQVGNLARAFGLPTTRGATKSMLPELRDELLDARLKSSNPEQLQAGVDELDRRIMEAGRRVQELGKQQDFNEFRRLLGSRKDASRRLEEIGVADKQIAAEKAATAEAVKTQEAQDKAAEAAKKAAAEATKARDARAREQEQIERTLRDRELDIRLHGDASEAAKVRAEIELGFYKDWSPAQRERLQQLAKEKDAITDLVRAAELEEKAREKSRAASQKLVDELGPSKTGRGFKRDITNSRLGEVDAIEDDALANEGRRFQEQMARLAIQRDDLMAMGADYNAMEEQAWEEHEAEKTRITREAEEQRRQLMSEGLGIAQGIFGDLATVAQAMGKDGFEAFKAFSIAEAMISTYRGALDAFMSAQKVYPPPMGQIVGGIAAAAITATGLAKVAQIRNMQYQGGREWGGNVSPGGYVRVGERKPELYEENGKFYLLPGERGGKVSPAKPGTGSAAPQVNLSVHDYVGAGVRTRTMSDGEIQVLIGEAEQRAATRAERQIAGGISTGQSPVAGAIGRRFGVQQKAGR